MCNFDQHFSAGFCDSHVPLLTLLISSSFVFIYFFIIQILIIKTTETHLLNSNYPYFYFSSYSFYFYSLYFTLYYAYKDCLSQFLLTSKFFNSKCI